MGLLPAGSPVVIIHHPPRDPVEIFEGALQYGRRAVSQEPQKEHLHKVIDNAMAPRVVMKEGAQSCPVELVGRLDRLGAHPASRFFLMRRQGLPQALFYALLL